MFNTAYTKFKAEFTLSEMNQYLSRRYEEKELYETLKPHFYDLDLFCDPRYNCKAHKPPSPRGRAGHPRT